MRVLLVEDNRRLNLSLKSSLVEDGYAVDAAFDGDEGEAFALSAPYDLIILDVMLPKKDGLHPLQANCAGGGLRTPILMLTARDAVEDRVLGLDSGADDYLVKPFALNELRARMRALLRRELEEKTGATGDRRPAPRPRQPSRGTGRRSHRADHARICPAGIPDAQPQPA